MEGPMRHTGDNRRRHQPQNVVQMLERFTLICISAGYGHERPRVLRPSCRLFVVAIEYPPRSNTQDTEYCTLYYT
jgi:hypothetical protein